MAYPNIAAECARNGITKTQLCKDLNICRKTFYNWEVKGHIPQKKLESMSKIFGVSVDYLLGRTNAP